MKILSNKWVLFFINLLLCFVFYYFSSTNNNFIVDFINVLFYMVFTYLFIALAMMVIKGRFLDGIIYGTRKTVSRMGSNRDYLDEWEEKQLPSERIHGPLIRIFFWQGLLLGTVMAVLLLVYFL